MAALEMGRIRTVRRPRRLDAVAAGIGETGGLAGPVAAR